MRIGDLDALSGAIYEKFAKHYGKSDIQSVHDFYRCVMKQIAKATSIDAVPVVRCKNCEHWNKGWSKCPHAGYPEPDDFCSYGEPKGGA